MGRNPLSSKIGASLTPCPRVRVYEAKDDSRKKEEINPTVYTCGSHLANKSRESFSTYIHRVSRCNMQQCLSPLSRGGGAPSTLDLGRGGGRGRGYGLINMWQCQLMTTLRPRCQHRDSSKISLAPQSKQEFPWASCQLLRGHYQLIQMRAQAQLFYPGEIRSSVAPPTEAVSRLPRLGTFGSRCSRQLDTRLHEDGPRQGEQHDPRHLVALARRIARAGAL